MPVKQITVKDIAKELRLHHTTVSKALRDHPDISPATKSRVIALAAELNYHPNSLAKNLKNHTTSTLGVIVPSIKNDFFAAAISGIEDVAYGRGFNAVVCQSNEDSQREAIHVRTLISHRVAGVLVSVAKTTTSPAHFEDLQKQGVPLIFFDRVCEGIEAGKVVVDDYRGALEAVRYLIQAGYRRIAHLAGLQNTSIGRDRYRGYVDALEQNGIAADDGMITYGGFDEEDGVAGFREIMSRGIKPDAVFAVNDPVAVGVHGEAKCIGLRIPQDLAIVGFGNNILASYLDPPLTTVAQSPYKLGKAAANMLFRRTENTEAEMTSEVEVIQTELIVRKST